MKLLTNKMPVAVFALLPGWSAWSAPVVEVQMRIATASTNDETLQLPLSVNSVCVGGQVLVEVWVSGIEAESPGIAGGTVNAEFSSNVEPLEIDHGSLFTELQTGMVDTLSGTIADLGGNTLILGAGSSPTWALLARVSFAVATAPGDAFFSLSPGSLRFALAGGEPPLDPATDVLLGSEQFLAIRAIDTFGDFDCDSRVDLTDFTVMRTCLAGPGEPSPTCDADSDGDTDLADFADFQVTYTGAGP